MPQYMAGFGDPTDEDLIVALKSGDTHAFDTIYARYAGRLHSFVLRQFSSEYLAQEVVQEVFATFWERRSTLSIHGTLRSYLYSAAYRRAADHLRHERVVQNVESAHAPDAREWMAKPADDPGSAVLANEANQFMARFILNLAPQQQAIMQLRWQHKLGFNEIAEILAITPAAAQKQASRLAITLREALKSLE